MNYFNPYPLCIDDSVATAWKSQIAEAAKTPSLADLMAQRGGELFPRFVTAYSELRALPRGARRALQRRLAHSRDLSAILQEWHNQQSGRALQQKLATTLAGAALLLVLGQGASDAATFTVNTNVPGIVADGKCSLIEAIINANNNAVTHSDCVVPGDPDPTEDHISLPSNMTFTLAAINNSVYGPNGLPLITSAITIEGNGSTITRKKSVPKFRLMAVTSTGNLELDNLTLRGGSAYYGGAIYNAGEVTISNSTITGNTAYIGGGIANAGTAAINGSTLSKNTVKGDIDNLHLYGGYGGGIANTGALNISNTTVSGNKALIGGAIVNAGNFTISDSDISKNVATTGAGLANNAGSAPTQTVTNSTISGNIAKLKSIRANGLIYFLGGLGGAVFNYNSVLTIANSTISGNSAKGKKIRGYLLGGAGGGIWNGNTSAANLTLTGGTVTNNKTTFFGGGLFNDHGVYAPGATFSGNTAKYGANIYNKIP